MRSIAQAALLLALVALRPVAGDPSPQDGARQAREREKHRQQQQQQQQQQRAIWS